MITHRVLPDFLIQTGLTRNENIVGSNTAAEIDGYLRQSSAVPSSSSSNAMSGDALGLDRKKLELNPRIRFNHRGQVAMAFPLEQSSSEGGGDDEDSAMLRDQFFVTLDEAPFLDAKHVVFGTIAGATMFNALRIGRTDADEQSGIPTDMKDSPPRIKSVKVDYHPFEDLVVTADKKIPWKANEASSSAGGKGKDGKQSLMEKRRKKRKGKRDLNVLSFGDEERDYEVITKKGVINSKEGGESMLSSHDVLSAGVDADVDKRSKKKDKQKKESKGYKTNQEEPLQKSELSPCSNSNDDGNPLSKVNQASIEKVAPAAPKEERKNGRSQSKEDRHEKSSKSSKSKSISAVEARRAKYLKSGSGSSANKKERLKREGDTMSRLFAFKNKVIETKGSTSNAGDGNGKAARKHAADDSLAARMAKRVKQTEEEEDRQNTKEEAFAAMPGYSGKVDQDGSDHSDNNDNTNPGDWMGTKFKCKRHMDQDSRMNALDKIDVDEMGGDGRRMDDYVVLDEKRNGRGKSSGHHSRHGDHREHGRHNGSGKHHKSSRSHK